jgi:hypothetical protein
MKARPIAMLDSLHPGQLSGAPPARDLLDFPASAAFVDEWERAAILGAMMRLQAATSDAPRAEGAASGATHRPSASTPPPTGSPGWSRIALVAIGFGVLVALLALCGAP